MPTKVDRFDRSRRFSAIFLTISIGILASATAAGMIYLYYKTSRF